MNRLFLFVILGAITIFSVTELSLFKIVPITSSATSEPSQEVDACSPQFYLNNMWKGMQSVRVQNACLEQINLKLDKLISLEESESKP